MLFLMQNLKAFILIERHFSHKTTKFRLRLSFRTKRLVLVFKHEHIVDYELAMSPSAHVIRNPARLRGFRLHGNRMFSADQ